MTRASERGSPSADTAFHRWWEDASAAQLAALLGGVVPPSLAGAGVCASCCSAVLRLSPPTAPPLSPANVASPGALAAYRAAHGSCATFVGACGGVAASKGRSGKRSASTAPCALATAAAYTPAHLAAFAARNPSLLSWERAGFQSALNAYLSERLLCEDCRLNVARAFGELRAAAAAQAAGACRCTPAFCCALREQGLPWWDLASYSLTAERLTAEWPGCHPAEVTYEYALGTDAALDDLRPWTSTGAATSADASVSLDASAAVFLSLRASFPDGRPMETVSSRAQPMLGEPCAHQRFTFSGEGAAERLSLSRGEGLAGLTAFFEHAAALQAEDAAEAAAAAAWEEEEGEGQDSHVDTPELAAEALLDAACVLSKERVEAAARQEAQVAHALGLAATAHADAAEAALRRAFGVVAAAAAEAALLAELEAEEAAAATRVAKSTAKGKKKEKAKPARRAPSPSRGPQTQPSAPVEMPSVPTPPRSEGASSPDRGADWSVAMRRRRRLAGAGGSVESLFEDGSGAGSECSAGDLPLRPQGTLPQPRPAPPPPPPPSPASSTPPAAASPPPWSQQRFSAWGPPLPPPPAASPLAARPPRAALTEAGTPGTPQTSPRPSLDAFYSAGSFSLFQMPIA